MATPAFRFEAAPELPGADRVSKYGFGAVRQLVHRLWDVTIEGVEHIPANGPAIIAPNHLSFCDSVFVPAALPRRVWAIGKGEYMDDWKTKHLFPAMGMIPVDRSGGDAAKAALDTAASVLDGGRLFMIYPEGTRSRSEFLHKGRTGASRLAARTSSPIIPVGHKGTLEVQPPDQFTMSTRLHVQVNFGEPMYIEDFGDPNDPRIHRTFTDAVMFRISELSGQTYVDTYAAKDDSPGFVSSLEDERQARPPISVPTGRPTAPKISSPKARTPKPVAPKGQTLADNVIDLRSDVISS